MKQKYYIPVDYELYTRLLQIAKDNDIAVSDLLKLVANINVRTVQLKDFTGKTIRVAYYANQKLLKLNKSTINYKILRFIELYEGNFG